MSEDRRRHASTAQPKSGHLSPGQIAEYLDAAVAPEGRRRVEAHLVVCDACLDEVIAALKQLRPPGGSRSG
jgi:anti-sigma factor RsiW